MHQSINQSINQNYKIGILYIATGQYIKFWQNFYLTAEKYLLPEQEKHYFLFTDSKNPNLNSPNVTLIYQEQQPWPYPTLKRFDTFLKIEQSLQEMDYLYFFNANMLFVDYISANEILPISQELVVTQHPYYTNTPRESFTYDANPYSWAYIPPDIGQYYFMGGLNGGKPADYLKLARRLKANIEADLENNIIALWHDESHLNRYMIGRENRALILPPSYGLPEEWLAPNVIDHFIQHDFDANILRQWHYQNQPIKIIIQNKNNSRFGDGEWRYK